jgi:hypothetical protein
MAYTSNMPLENAAANRVYVPVPADRVDDVFRFLLGITEAEASKDGDVDHLIRRIFRESEQSFRDLLHLLARHAGSPMSTEEIAETLDLFRGTASLAGMLGAYGRRANNRYDGFSPFERLYNAADDRHELVMPQEIGEIIEQIVATES